MNARYPDIPRPIWELGLVYRAGQVIQVSILRDLLRDRHFAS